MSYNQMLAQAASQNEVDILPGWTQGRATFGGVVAALMLENLLTLAGPDLPLRSLTVSFVAPVAEGPVQLQPLILRRGKSVMQAQCSMLQQGQVVAVMLCSFGAGRNSAIEITPASVPAFSAPDEVLRFPFIPNVTPEFTRQFDFRFAIGQLPFTNNPSGIMGGWIRFKELPSQPCSVSHLLGLVDAWPPSVLQMCNGFAPASSLTWTLELLRDPSDCTTSDWWQYLAEAEQAGDGYAQIAAKCWNQRGELIAITRQTVTVFA